jgi:hypothetical protein
MQEYNKHEITSASPIFAPARLAPPAPQAGGPLPSACASCTLRLELCGRRSSSHPHTPTARRSPSSESPPRLAAPARSPRPPYCVPSALLPSPSEPCPLPLLPLAATSLDACSLAPTPGRRRLPAPPHSPTPASPAGAPRCGPPVAQAPPPPLLPTPLPIRKRSARTGGGLRDDALELAVARICAGEQTVVYSAGFGQLNEEISTFMTVLPDCELAENDLLSPPPAQETERTEGRRTSGRSLANGCGLRTPFAG